MTESPQVIFGKELEFATPDTPYNRLIREVLNLGLIRLGSTEPRISNPKDGFLSSVAIELGPAAVAVALSGMGWDGAEGIKAIRDSGGFTIAQDEETSVAYGTARFAMNLNAVCESIPDHDIASRLVNIVSGNARAT